MGKWIHRAFVLATSLVPLAGVLWLGWSASTFLLVFWAETLLSGTANVLRIWLHRRLTRATGHFRKQLDDRARVRSEGRSSRRRDHVPRGILDALLRIHDCPRRLPAVLPRDPRPRTGRESVLPPGRSTASLSVTAFSPLPGLRSSSFSTTRSVSTKNPSPGSKQEFRSRSRGSWSCTSWWFSERF